MLSAAVASAAPKSPPGGVQWHRANGELPDPLPGNLAQAMSQFIEAHPQWDQYRLMQAALAGFLLQQGCNNATSHAVTSAACLAAGSSLKKRSALWVLSRPKPSTTSCAAMPS